MCPSIPGRQYPPAKNERNSKPQIQANMTQNQGSPTGRHKTTATKRAVHTSSTQADATQLNKGIKRSFCVHRAEQARTSENSTWRAGNLNSSTGTVAIPIPVRPQQPTGSPPNTGVKTRRHNWDQERPLRAEGAKAAATHRSRLLHANLRPVARPTRSVDAYRVLNSIGEGTYGCLSRAENRNTGQVVALKRLKNDEKIPSGIPTTGLREIQILKACSHENIVSCIDVVMGKSLLGALQTYIVLEFVENDLAAVLATKSEPFTQSEVKLLMHQLCKGLEYLHDRYIMHRDIKASNILLSNRGVVKIADLGMARSLDTGVPLTAVVTTLWYRSPEVLLGSRTYDYAIDMWSLGCVFAELLTSRALLPGDTEVRQLEMIFTLVGNPDTRTWPRHQHLPNFSAAVLRPPVRTPPDFDRTLTWSGERTGLYVKFGDLLPRGAFALLEGLLRLNPELRWSIGAVRKCKYFAEPPKMKQQSLFPTFPSNGARENKGAVRLSPPAPPRIVSDDEML